MFKNDLGQILCSFQRFCDLKSGNHHFKFKIQGPQSGNIEREDLKNRRKRMKINSKDMHELNLCQLGHSFYIDLPGAKVVEKFKFFFER